ncbi:hypothetical protein [Vibrio vulnificus]|uniref:hypothetical protein n=1 Tax=Vibrio vulnificus TaxID=672 RepID=UPI0005F20761|nr:hypothetical protein [Vibrio vulnificus]EHT4939868.1 hypothetical protein [Vibrio vulnificus]EHT4943864.1 hypothetical protein [Vibrio vulnificus]OJI27812.1 hypothetical protein VV99796_01788 [Vibrio vulnificus]OJI52830.1 hypothetical protein VVS316_00303 [Vibrio vulnificus]POB07730.1 hypothetical protein CRN33_07060 [Vibrio vulnificus]
MKSAKEILYIYTVESLESLIKTDVLDKIEEKIIDDNLDVLLSSMQYITKCIDELENAYLDDDGYFDNFNEISEVLKNAKPLFQPFVNNIDRIITFCQYASNIVKFDLNLDDIEIDKEMFKTFSDINLPGYKKCYFHENTDIKENSVIFFENSCPPEFNNDSIFIFLLFLSFLSDKNLTYTNNFIVIKDIENVTKSKSEAYLKLHLLASGYYYHDIRLASIRNKQHEKNLLAPEHTLQQFDDSLIIISEYNSRREILNKFLSIYQLIENFMYKHPLVKLNENHNGEMFSIRNFKDMYERIGDSELNSLFNLLNSIYDDSFESGTLLSELASSFHNLVSNGVMEKADIDHALKSLGIKQKSGTLYTYDILDGFSAPQRKAEWPRIISKIIYYTRNAIVHNKETEFHLSHNYLSESIYKFIDIFILSECENLIYKLIYKPNNIIWYAHDRIKLYANS